MPGRAEVRRSLRDAIKISAAIRTHNPEVRRASFFSKWFVGVRSWKAAFLVAAACLVLVVPVLVLFKQLKSTGDELAQVTTTSAQLQERYKKELEANLVFKREFETAQLVGPAVFILSQTRGDNAAERPANKIAIPPEPRWIVLTLEQDLSEFRSYRATLRDHEGNIVWQKDNLEPSSRDAVSLSFLSTLLRSGDYVLSLEGIGRRTPRGQSSTSFSTGTSFLGGNTNNGERYVSIAKYSVRAVK